MFKLKCSKMLNLNFKIWFKSHDSHQRRSRSTFARRQDVTTRWNLKFFKYIFQIRNLNSMKFEISNLTFEVSNLKFGVSNLKFGASNFMKFENAQTSSLVWGLSQTSSLVWEVLKLNSNFKIEFDKFPNFRFPSFNISKLQNPPASKFAIGEHLAICSRESTQIL